MTDLEAETCLVLSEILLPRETDETLALDPVLEELGQSILEPLATWDDSQQFKVKQHYI